jgi:hypothetical protein
MNATPDTTTGWTRISTEGEKKFTQNFGQETSWKMAFPKTNKINGMRML